MFNTVARSLFKPWIFLLLVWSGFPDSALAVNPESSHRLWYRQAAAHWVEALPVGNGRLGAMVFGGEPLERIQFNEDTLWTAGPRAYHREGAVEYLEDIRNLISAGKQDEAQSLAAKTFMGEPLRQAAYQPLGDLYLSTEHKIPRDYRRELDLDGAVARVSYTYEGVTYTREVFASYPDQVIVVRFSADRAEALSFRAFLTSPHRSAAMHSEDRKTLVLEGGVDAGQMRFQAQLRARHRDGAVEISNDGIEVRDATEVELLLTASTNFRKYDDLGADPGERNSASLDAVVGHDYQALLERHQADHRQLYGRAGLEMGGSAIGDRPTDERLLTFNQDEDPALAALMFHYGRYLLIASSRPGSQPANLQGVWNESLQPPWESKWTLNINAEMNYWPAEVTNLAECHLPFFDLIDDLVQTGAATARAHYGAGGWMSHHNTDLWRGSAPINSSTHGIWVTSNGWLSRHMWDHYRFGGDRQFLRERAYPVMKGASEFFIDFLVEDAETGWLISTPSNSPENGGMVAGPTMDHQIIRDLFANTAAAARILELDEDLAIRLTEMAARIAPNQIGRYGQLQEWLEDIDDPNNTHRHVSHLWGLYPGDEISLRRTPELARASRVALEHRGDAGTSWSSGWKINLWARLMDGDRAYRILRNQLDYLPVISPASIRVRGERRHRIGGTYPNGFTAHPPFQIDGNFGLTAGIAEMLLQSHEDEIHLLPALPAAWPDGHVYGLRARGGFEVNLTWIDGQLRVAEVVPDRSAKVQVRYGGRVVTLDAKAHIPLKLHADSFGK